MVSELKESLDKLEEVLNTNLKWKVINIRSQIMAMMLNGTLDWDKGCAIRSLDDETLIDKLGK